MNILSKKKKISHSSRRWLDRHLKDEFSQLAKKRGYRSRAAFKLIQINQKFQIFANCKNVLDLGCFPGGWLQVIKELTKPGCKILGVDKLKIRNIDNVTFFQKDIFEDTTIQMINFFFKKKIDLVLSDMSPNASGNRNVDHLKIISLADKVLELSKDILKHDKYLVIKIFQGGAQGQLLENLKENFTYIKYFKPKASRKESAETYLICKKINN
tara:strand:- start:1052 stop:1690 length:639 start_codon:yes stop_codon:yes gene_type:complete